MKDKNFIYFTKNTPTDTALSQANGHNCWAVPRW